VEEVCQLIVGYRGLIDLARRSGQIESIEAHVVHENDRFTCRYGLDPKLEHEPCWQGDPGPVKAVYASRS
jgi:recombination protein RecT